MNAPTTPTTARGPRRPVTAARESGFVIVAVLVISGLIASLAATYAHHVIAADRSNLASPDLVESREAAHSSAEFARQALMSGQAVASSWASPDGSTSTVAVSAPSDLVRQITVETVGPSGSGAVKVVEATLTPDPSSTPSGPDDLPHLPTALIDSLMADSSIPKTYYSSDTILADTDLYGLHIIEDGVRLELNDVILTGAIVTERTLQTGSIGSFDASDPPELVIGGALRIDSSSALPGVAILMPDGVVSTGWDSGNVQIHGDVVAHGIDISRGGALDGNVRSVTGTNLASDLDLIGTERRPQSWSDDFEWGDTWDPSSLAVIPAYTSAGELSNIIGYWSN